MQDLQYYVHLALARRAVRLAELNANHHRSKVKTLEHRPDKEPLPLVAWPCMSCGEMLEIRLALGRKSNKPFLMVICPNDGRHFRGFIGDLELINRLMEEGKAIVGG